jgi:hypothetical protein
MQLWDLLILLASSSTSPERAWTSRAGPQLFSGLHPGSIGNAEKPFCGPSHPLDTVPLNFFDADNAARPRTPSDMKGAIVLEF